MRVVDKRYEPFTRYIGRGSLYGNPFSHLPIGTTKATVQVATVERAVQCYREWLDGNPKWAHMEPERRLRILAAIPYFREEEVLGCYCRPRHVCHGDVLVELWQQLKEAVG